MAIHILSNLKEEMKKWTWHHTTVFLLTYFLYAFYHASRKAISNIIDRMEKSLTPYNGSMFPFDVWQKENMFGSTGEANVFIGELEFLFLIAYAIGLYICGYVGDRVNLRVMLTVGMCGSAVLTFLFGYLTAVLHIRNKTYLRITYFVNGLFQSSGWPAVIAVMGNWFSKKSSGLVFGIWSSNSSLGNIIGSLIVSEVIDYGYEFGMLLNSLLLFFFAWIICICLIPHPNMIGLNSPDSILSDEKSKLTTSSTDLDSDSVEYSSANSCKIIELSRSSQKAIGFLRAFSIPGVSLYALAYACLKVVSYAFFFWLPTYLSQGLEWEDKRSDELSNFYDVGGIIGSIVVGFATDLIGVRSPLVCLLLFFAMITMYLYHSVGGHYAGNVILMLVNGFMITGPANTITTSITVDLGKHEKIRGNADALATVSGIIDGTGSVGAAIGQYLVGLISLYGGWNYVFYFLILMIFFCFSLILPIVYRESKTHISCAIIMVSKRRRSKSSEAQTTDTRNLEFSSQCYSMGI